MTPDASTPDATTWPADWPPAQLTGLTTIRILILPTRRDQGDLKDWRLTASRGPNDTLRIIGEIIRAQGGGFLAVATAADIRFASNQAPPMATDNELDNALKRYGPWVAHALWDYSRIVLLQAAAGLPLQPALEVPAPTPEPMCYTRAMQRDVADKSRHHDTNHDA